MTATQLVQLRNMTLEQLGALQILFGSARWRDRLANASLDLRHLAMELELVVEARFLKLQNLPLSRLAERLQSNSVPLTRATEQVADALDDIRDVGRVITAASELATITTRVIAAL